MASSVKRLFFTLNGQNKLWGHFDETDKRTLFGVEASGAQHSTFFLLVFFYKWEQKHAWLIDACLLSIIASTCFICELIKLIKRFQGIHSCLSPVEIPDLNPPQAFKLPVISVHHTFGCLIQRTLLALRIPRGHPWYGMWVFSGMTQWQIIFVL